MLDEKNSTLVQLLYDTFIKQTKLAAAGVLPTFSTEVSYTDRHVNSTAADVMMNCETSLSYDIGYKAVYKKFNVRLVRDPSDSAVEFSVGWPPHRQGYVVLEHRNDTLEMNDVIQHFINMLNEHKDEITEIWKQRELRGQLSAPEKGKADYYIEYSNYHNSWSVFERNRVNEFGERFCVVPHVSFEEAERILANLKQHGVAYPFEGSDI